MRRVLAIVLAAVLVAAVPASAASDATRIKRLEARVALLTRVVLLMADRIQADENELQAQHNDYAALVSCIRPVSVGTDTQKNGNEVWITDFSTAPFYWVVTLPAVCVATGPSPSPTPRFAP